MRQNDAFSQQVLSRLNHRIKQQKRSEKRIDTACSRFAKQLYKLTKPLKYLALIELVLVPFVTKPRWCIDLFKGTSDYDTCGYNPNFIAEAAAQGHDDYLLVGYPSS